MHRGPVFVAGTLPVVNNGNDDGNPKREEEEKEEEEDEEDCRVHDTLCEEKDDDANGSRRCCWPHSARTVPDSRSISPTTSSSCRHKTPLSLFIFNIMTVKDGWNRTVTHSYTRSSKETVSVK